MKKAPGYFLMQLPSVDQLVALYSGSMEIRLLAEQLLRRTLELGRVAINTEVVASRANVKGQPFTVIAKEVSRLTHMITEEIGHLFESGNHLSREAVKATAGARLCEKFATAIDLGIRGDHNQNLLIETRVWEGRRLKKVMNKMRDHLEASSRNARDLSRLAIHIPVIASMFRIEAARTERELASAFASMGDTLLQFNEQMQKELEHLLGKAQKTLEQLDHALCEG